MVDDVQCGLSCELLSKIIIFVMKDNCLRLWCRICTVVNCFQKLLSSWWRTTASSVMANCWRLWIAFKNYYLRDEGQPSKSFSNIKRSCELLSKIIIFVMKDNGVSILAISVFVVNCFQKLLSSWWRTTELSQLVLLFWLWIAFKNYYLRDEGQLKISPRLFGDSCELLSKIIIFVMKDNKGCLYE